MYVLVKCYGKSCRKHNVDFNGSGKKQMGKFNKN